ncbi:uncharacterized protein K444DRAFT_42154 [Hyaloscypha bicolor E]|uniref:Uncharacterized protein n=1 Tax=Hyaloscypha bicolor E TaxID=1095630 RepID=A0A2J6T1T0_9HELO|nr:uncharacterized protein K444DRAFT_42154 [Hyaloscypha bicolor E]PMD56988.1 hypothetical protein K444DRAFT_42154 [Hyaloscypha bicolor E]
MASTRTTQRKCLSLSCACRLSACLSGCLSVSKEITTVRFLCPISKACWLQALLVHVTVPYVRREPRASRFWLPFVVESAKI